MSVRRRHGGSTERKRNKEEEKRQPTQMAALMRCNQPTKPTPCQTGARSTAHPNSPCGMHRSTPVKCTRTQGAPPEWVWVDRRSAHFPAALLCHDPNKTRSHCTHTHTYIHTYIHTAFRQEQTQRLRHNLFLVTTCNAAKHHNGQSMAPPATVTHLGATAAA